MSGPFLVALAALLWATDNIVRYPASTSLTPLILVFAEHLIGFLLIFPWVFFRHRNEVFTLNRRELFAATVIGVGGAALAGIFYTASIQAIGLSIPILIEKIQPILVLVLAYALLGERVKTNFLPWAPVALFSVTLISFPDLDLSNLGTGQYVRGIIYAISAMAMWGFSTIAGKYLLRRHSASVASFWRYLLASLTLFTMVSFSGQSIPWKILTSPAALPSLLYMGSVSGVFAMWIYYQGLKQIPASVSTFIELLYPLGGLVLSSAFLKIQLSFVQILGTVLLILSIALLAIPKTKKYEEA